jgi:hypothetical protein
VISARACYHQNVSWNIIFTLCNFDHVTNFNICPTFLSEKLIIIFSFSLENEDFLVILCFVLFEALEVFVAIFEHGHDQDQTQGHQVGRVPSGDCDRGPSLHHTDEHEINVRVLLKLLEKVLGHKV